MGGKPTPPKHTPPSPTINVTYNSNEGVGEAAKPNTALLIKEEEIKLWAAIDSALKDYVCAVKEIKSRAESVEGGGDGREEVEVAPLRCGGKAATDLLAYLQAKAKAN